MAHLIYDLRYAVRAFSKTPGFTAVAVLTLAAGIGLNTAVFSVVQATLLQSFPYPKPDQLITVWEHSKHNDRNSVSPANFLDWQSQNHVFSGMAAISDSTYVLRGQGEVEELFGQAVNPNLFDILGMPALYGRTFNAAERKPGGPHVVVLGYGLWERRFGADPNVVGRSIRLDDDQYTVIGVMPPSFQNVEGMFFKKTELWVPLVFTPGRDYRKKAGRYLAAIARVKDGVSLDQAQSEMNTIAQRLERDYPEFNTGWRINLIPWHTAQTSEIKPALLLLAGGVGMVLLIACANVANLLLVRGSGRRREIAIRGSLGAGRGDIVGQLLVESTLLSFSGGVVGLLLAWSTIPALLRLAPADLPREQYIGVHGPVLAFTVAVSLITGMLFGLAPAFEATRLSLNEALKSTALSVAGRSRHLFRNALVVGELALSVMLLIGAVLLTQSFLKLSAVNPGFRTDHMLTSTVSLSGAIGNDKRKTVQFYRSAIEKIRSIPGVDIASGITFLPLDGLGAGTGFDIVGEPKPGPGQQPGCAVRIVSDQYFQTMGIPLLEGRAFTEREATDVSAPRTFVVSQSLADRYWPKHDAIGHKIVVDMGDDVPGEIVGVAGDIRHEGLNKPVEPTVYYAHPQLPIPLMTFVAHTKTDANAVSGALRAAIKSVDATQAVGEVRPMETYVGKSIARWRFEMILLSVFAAVALLLAMVGLYGVLSSLVLQRVPEIGVRVALGATQSQVLRLIMGESLAMATGGVAVGIVGGLLGSRVIASLLYGVQPNHPATYALVSLILLMVTCAASYLPARRAMRVDPVTALRYE